jgi:hypothetical protein
MFLGLFSCADPISSKNKESNSDESDSSSSLSTIEDILCGAGDSGNVDWDLQISSSPPQRMNFLFMSNGTLSGKIYEFHLIPEQVTAGFWQVDEDRLVLSYSCYIPNLSGVGEPWSPITTNVILRITGVNKNQIITYYDRDENNATMDYMWIFSR